MFTSNDTTMVLIRVYGDGRQYTEDFGYAPQNLMPDVMAEYARPNISHPNGNQIYAFVDGAHSHRIRLYKAIQKLTTAYAKKGFCSGTQPGSTPVATNLASCG